MVREASALPNTRNEDRDRLALVAEFDAAGDQPGAIDGLVDAGFLLPRDRRQAFEAAIERWTWARRADR